MPSYNKQQDITGKKWVRAHRVTINNPLNGVPTICFDKESILETSDGSVSSTTIGETRAFFDAPDFAFDLLNPETGEVIGQATHQQVYVMLHSLFISLDSRVDPAQADPLLSATGQAG